MQELREGVWWWTAPHPDWRPGAAWDREVSSYAFDCGETFVLVDPLSPPQLVDELAAGRDVVVALTTPSHRRSADELGARLGAHVHETGAELPACVVAQASYWGDEETPLWIPAYGALVFGDSLLGGDDGVRIPDEWLPETTSHDDAAAALRPLLDLPVELVLPTHGAPADRDALARALAGS
jgi:hypothetical protein